MASIEADSGKTPPPGFVPVTRRGPFMAMVGPFYEVPGDAENRRGFIVREEHLNAAGAIHGGMVVSFADNMLISAVSNSGAGPSVTLRLTTDFIGPAHAGDWIEGKAKVVRTTRTLAFVQGEVFTRKRLILTANAVFRRLGRERRKG